MARIFARLACIGAISAGIAGCAHQNPPASPAAVAAIAPGPVATDGVYQGSAFLTAAGPSEQILCGTNIPLQLTVTDRSFTYVLNEPQVTYAPVKRFLAQIGPDGSFVSQSGAARLQGKIVGTGLSGDAIGEACSFHFDTARPG